MNLISIFFIGFAMSTDAFAASIGKGIAIRNPSLASALRIGLIFGVIEAITPIIGWLIGQAATSFVQEWDHWIALALLTALGLHMIHNGIRGTGDEDETEKRAQGFWGLALTGFATSIDAMAVGVGLAFLDVNIFLVAAVIGFCTFLMVTIGVMLGRVLGQKVGDKAEILGGLILILVGVMIAFEHING